MGMEHVTALIIQYRYWILIPLSFVEGPIVAFVAGTLAAGGYFNPFILAGFFFVRDVLVDTVCYVFGYLGAQTRIIKKVLAKLGVTEDHLAEVRALWHKHPGKTMFFSKLSYGLAAGFIVVAGMIEMPYNLFIAYGAIIAILHYCVLVFVGYFFGVAFGGTITNILEKIPYVLAVAGVLGLIYFFFKGSITKKLKKMEADEGKKS